MGKAKLKKYAAFSNHNLALEYENPDSKKILKSYISHENVVLELACGAGDYALRLALMYLEKKIVAIDIKGDRLLKGAQKAWELNLTNILFFRANIRTIAEFFAKESVNEIWITFPDPFPKDKQEKHRLTHPAFLNHYYQILKPGGILHLKTDSRSLFEYSVETITNSGFDIKQIINNVHDTSLDSETDTLLKHTKTYYENIHMSQGKKIQYLRAYK